MKISDHIPAALETAKSITPLNVLAEVRAFDWQIDAYNDELKNALLTVQEFCAAMVHEARERRRIHLERTQSAARRVDEIVEELQTQELPDNRVDALRAEALSLRNIPRLPIQGHWLTFCGPNGCGKTHLAGQIERWRLAQGGGSPSYRWIDIIDRARDPDRLANLQERVSNPKLMIIDDIGAGYDTAFSDAILGEIAERRVRLWTVFTSNLSAEQIAEQIDTRVASRMIRDGSKVFEFTETEDYALRA